MKSHAVKIVAGAALYGLITAHASAMPMSNMAVASNDLSTNLHEVGWLCGPFRCWWRPNYYYDPFYGPRVYYGYAPGSYGYGPSWYGPACRGLRCATDIDFERALQSLGKRSKR
jgi:hypothetical protein